MVQRKRAGIFVVGLVLLPLGGVALKAAGPSTGIISSARAIDWSTAGVSGGIPTVTTKCGATLGSNSTQSEINNAINACASSGGGYVLLDTGTFNLSGPPILKTNVELRGSGMGTILNVTNDLGSTWYWGGGAGALIIQGNYAGSEVAPGLGSVPSGTIKAWSGTSGTNGVYTQGATVLNLGSTPTGLSVGDMLVCFQNNASSASLPTPGFFFSDKTGTSNAISWVGEYSDFGAAQQQRSIVTAISGTAVTIADPIAHPTGTWATGQIPRCGWLNAAQTIRNAGVSNLLVRTTNWTSPHQCVICIAWAYNVWIKGVALQPRVTSFHAGGAVDFGIIVNDSTHVTIRDSWIDKMIGGGLTTTTSYGVALQQAHFSLIENNIYSNVESPQELLVGSMGNVIAYNYERYVGDDSQEGGVQQHSVGSSMNLVEGNTFRKFFADAFHGNALLSTYFRNHLSGGGVDLWSYHRWFNFIGNVINSSTAYQSLATDSTKRDRFSRVAFRLGYPQQNASSGTTNGVALDSVVWTSLFRWGNYSVFDDATHFDASEVPTVDPLFPNAVPSSQTLPPSFYRSVRPAWWPSAKPWPAIGPDVTGGNIAGYGGRVYTTPAQDCYVASGGAIASFNATTCYPAGSGSAPPAPSAPTSLRIVT